MPNLVERRAVIEVRSRPDQKGNEVVKGLILLPDSLSLIVDVGHILSFQGFWTQMGWEKDRFTELEVDRHRFNLTPQLSSLTGTSSAYPRLILLEDLRIFKLSFGHDLDIRKDQFPIKKYSETQFPKGKIPDFEEVWNRIQTS